MAQQMLKMINQLKHDILKEQIQQEMKFLDQQPADLEVLNQNFYIDDNFHQQKEETTETINKLKKYNLTKVKARIFLTNIS